MWILWLRLKKHKRPQFPKSESKIFTFSSLTLTQLKVTTISIVRVRQEYKCMQIPSLQPRTLALYPTWDQKYKIHFIRIWMFLYFYLDIFNISILIFFIFPSWYFLYYPSIILWRLHDFAARWDQLIPEKVSSVLSW